MAWEPYAKLNQKVSTKKAKQEPSFFVDPDIEFSITGYDLDDLIELQWHLELWINDIDRGKEDATLRPEAARRLKIVNNRIKKLKLKESSNKPSSK